MACCCTGGWICAAHPEQGWPHGDCIGPGAPCLHGNCDYGLSNRAKQLVDTAIDEDLQIERTLPERRKRARDKVVAMPAHAARLLPVTLAKAGPEAGAYYVGLCRHGTVARWDGAQFHYWHRKAGRDYVDQIRHPQFDVFVPVAKFDEGQEMWPIDFEDSQPH